MMISSKRKPRRNEMTKTTIYDRAEYLATVRKLVRGGKRVSVRPITKLGKTVAWVITY